MKVGGSRLDRVGVPFTDIGVADSHFPKACLAESSLSEYAFAADIIDVLQRSISSAHPFPRSLNVEAKVGALDAAAPPGSAVAIAAKPAPGSTTLA
ncbi:hypothetical protein Rhe02_19680 [Rhizocola hellebori]|uniref:Uncharacterized protein n=1 Tax=Rhizocola hellebori TaxID=1392758 RepID=A0A8J3Q547_9ACTN|nr:hypothetical protein Rhe02_19680 [Rhizocola hellebori]